MGQLSQRNDMKTTPVSGRLAGCLRTCGQKDHQLDGPLDVQLSQVDQDCTEAGALEVRLQSASGLVQGREAIHRFSPHQRFNSIDFWWFMMIYDDLWHLWSIRTLMYFVSGDTCQPWPVSHTVLWWPLRIREGPISRLLLDMDCSESSLKPQTLT